MERRWGDNGQLSHETDYVNGEKHGLLRRWKINGAEFNFSPLCYRDGYSVFDWREGEGTCL